MNFDERDSGLHRMSRRRFLESSLLSAAGLSLGYREVCAMETPSVALENRFFRARFSPSSGKLNVWRDGRLFLSNAIARAVTSDGIRSTSDADYTRTTSVHSVSDVLGAGRQLVARCADGRKQLDFEIRVTVYDSRDAFVLEVISRNASTVDIIVQGTEPLRAIADEGTGLLWPGVTKVLTNGKMYYNAGQVAGFGPGAEVGGWWNVGFYRGDNAPGLALGYLNNNIAMGEVSVKHGLLDAADAISLTVQSTYDRGFTLKPGATVTSDPVIFHMAGDPWTALEEYAQAVGDAHKVQLNPVVTGWCTWSYAYGQINEDELIRNAEFAARHLKPYGFSVMQIDDGYYRAFGDWEGNANFPHGMKWMAAKIRDIGLVPGLWLAPYTISASTEVARQHPDWLVHRRDRKLLHIGPNLPPDPDEKFSGETSVHALDITHPGAADWFLNLFRTVTQDWGYDFIKTDFVDWSLLAAERYHDPTVTKAEAYRRGAALMREGMGAKCHLLDCGPGPVSVGYLDSMRIELDQPPVNWNQYFLQSASTAPAMAKRYYFHKRTWINDADQLMMDNMTVTQAQAAASLLGLSGGTLICSDRLPDLEPARLDILRKVMPPFGEAARPVDLWETDRHTTFALPVKRPFGEWIVLGLFNPSEKEPVEKSVSLERLRLDPAKTYVAWDFWGERLHSEIRGAVTARLAPASGLLLAIHEMATAPFVIGTDRHVTQGGVELEAVTWDAAAETLRGVSLGPAGTTHRVYVYLPGDGKRPEPPYVHRDFPGFTQRMLSPRIVRVQVRFDGTDRVSWQVPLKDFSA